MSKCKNIAILGSTGSIGTQALEVIREHPELFSVEVLTANTSADSLILQAKEFKPDCVVIGDESLYSTVEAALSTDDIKVYAGTEALCQVTTMSNIDIVLTAIVGIAGLRPTISAIGAKKNIALANKETLVVAGHIITKLAIENNVDIIPVDSEHSAIFQCLVGEHFNKISKLILTASGGPFRDRPINTLKEISVKEALAHPNWNMGDKITIDSATMMNKGLEVIEAKWLFAVEAKDIEVVVHPQSVIHSAVQFEDTSVKAQIGLPNMKIPIQYAMSFPTRQKSDSSSFSFFDYPNLTFEKPDLVKFPCLALAFEALNRGGSTPCVLNGANEELVDKFLRGEIKFDDIPKAIEIAINTIQQIDNPSLEECVELDKETRKLIKTIIK
ncbi:MAG: 1-deoxy-D-xylulose-5-phosphate reductoisomerase [Bacteroidales bacterium]